MSQEQCATFFLLQSHPFQNPTPVCCRMFTRVCLYLKCDLMGHAWLRAELTLCIRDEKYVCMYVNSVAAV